MQDEKRIEIYEKIMEYEQKIHENNQKRIRIGIRLVIIIPLIFLAIMFKMGSSKVVFLVLWIVSLFGLSLYLIIVEYMDYQMQMKLKEFGMKDENDDIKNLISDDLVVEKVIENAGLFEEKLEEETEAVKPDKAEQPVGKAKIEPASVQTVGKAETTTGNVQAVELSQAEEELVESIRKYVVTLGKQAVQTSSIGETQRKEAQDYAAMRRARAESRRTRCQEDGQE